DLREAGDAKTADAAGIIRVHRADRHAGVDVLALITETGRVAAVVVDPGLEVDLLFIDVAVNAGAEVRRGEVRAVEHRGALHPVVPEGLFPVDPRGLHQAELVGQGAAFGGV